MVTNYDRGGEKLPVYVLQAEEIPALKDLRELLDKEFLSDALIWHRVAVYFDFYPTREGVDKWLRNLLFPMSLRTKRGDKAAPVDTSEGRRPRGRPRKGTVQTEAEKKAAIKARKDADRRNQRQSRTKERCENRLFSLLFACLYEITTKECRLSRKVPPLKVIKADKAGKMKSYTDYDDVRKYLRKVMASIIADQSAGFRAIAGLASVQAEVLPATFITVARTFVAMQTLQVELRNDADDINLDERSKAAFSIEVLKDCLNSIMEYAEEWWRRNLTSDIELPNTSAIKKRDHPLFTASESLLRTMVEVIPPSEPNLLSFRNKFLYNTDTSGSPQCSMSLSQQCLICQYRTNGEDDISSEMETSCHRFVEALQTCSSLSGRFPPTALEHQLSLRTYEPNAAVWRHAYAQSALHRLGVQSRSLKDERHSETDRDCSMRRQLLRDFIGTVRWHVGCLWVALYSSNEASLTLLRGLQLPTVEVMRRTTVEAIFGGTVAAQLVMEQNDAIIKAARHFQETAEAEQPPNTDEGAQNPDEGLQIPDKDPPNPVGEVEAQRVQGEEEPTIRNEEELHQSNKSPPASAENRPGRVRRTRTRNEDQLGASQRSQPSRKTRRSNNQKAVEQTGKPPTTEGPRRSKRRRT